MGWSRFLGVGLVLAGGAVAVAADGPVAVPEPAFRRAATAPPAEAAAGAPFDVRRLFAVPPPGRNAAPLYLDALFEFGAELSGCFDGDPAAERRLLAARERSAAVLAVLADLEKDPKGVTADRIDAAVRAHAEGFRKLAAAQARPDCVFVTALGVDALLPHVQVARQVERVAALKARREAERGEFDAAADDLRTVLRLARDLRPRGYLVTQLSSAATSVAAVREVLPPVLAAPGLRPADCDRLLAVLAEAAAADARLDPYADAANMEYLVARTLLNDLVRDTAKLARAFGLKEGESVTRALVSMLATPFRKGPGAAPQADALGLSPRVEPDPAAGLPPDADARLALTGPAELDAAVEQLNAYQGAVLANRVGSYADRIAKAADPDHFIRGGDVVSVVLREILVHSGHALAAAARAELAPRAGQCLVALRRWELTHPGEPLTPAVLGPACVAAGLPGVPADPFDGRPLRLALAGGRPVVYSVGRDGRDDGGADSKFDTVPGDLAFPAAAGR